MATISGKVGRIVFQGDKGWGVYSVRCDKEAVTAVGVLPAIVESEHVVLKGEWGEHPKYGKQFKFKDYEIRQPSDTEGIAGFLTRLSGIGQDKAYRIIRHFGSENVFEILEKEIHKLAEVSGITPGMVDMIREDYHQHRRYRESIAGLKKYGLTDYQADLIIKKYRDDAIKRVREDPYVLMFEVKGFGFKKTDKVALAMGVDRKDDRRIAAFILWSIDEATAFGNCFLAIPAIKNLVAKEIGADEKKVDKAIKKLRDMNEITIEKGRAWPVNLHAAEEHVAGRIKSLLSEGGNNGIRSERPTGTSG